MLVTNLTGLPTDGETAALLRPLLRLSHAIGALMGLIDTAALQCVGLVIFPLLGVLGYLSTRDGADADESTPSGKLQLVMAQVGNGLRRLAGAVLKAADEHPEVYLVCIFGTGITIGLLTLFWNDLERLARQRQRAWPVGGYAPLDEQGVATAGVEKAGTRSDGGVSSRAAPPPPLRQLSSIQKLEAELRHVSERTEELQIREMAHDGAAAAPPAPAASAPTASPTAASASAVSKAAAPPSWAAIAAKNRIRADLKQLAARHRQLKMELAAELGADDDGGASSSCPPPLVTRATSLAPPHPRCASSQSTAMALPSTPPPAASAPSPRAMSCWARFSRSNFASVLQSSTNGLMTVSIYFADVISDIQVMRRLWHGHHYIWGSQAALLLIGQYLAVYFRALSYFRQTFGACSCMHVAFAAVGFPFGLLALDLLMFLEPFGLLAVLPLPLWLKQFLPAYKATRIVIEVSLESLPQCTLQSYIFLVIQRRLADGTASANDRKLSSFATLLPKSIFISSAAMLKTWVELVRSSRRAGLTVRARFVQLWHVGAGLPFDALKKGTISEWACARPLDAAEVPPILDALATNASLVRLDLCASGLCWSKPDDTGYPLVETLIAKPAALANVHTLLIADGGGGDSSEGVASAAGSREPSGSGYAIPLDRIRHGGDAALEALSRTRFFAPDGPQRVHIIFMADLLRHQPAVDAHMRGPGVGGGRGGSGGGTASTNGGGGSRAALRLISAAQAGRVDRNTWEARLKTMMVEGLTTRGQVLALTSLQVLRCVGIGLQELHEGAGVPLASLKADGHFTAAEFLSYGVPLRRVLELGFSDAELCEAHVSAASLHGVGWPATRLRAGGYSTAQLKAGGYTLAELKGAGCRAKELRAAGYTITELRRAGASVVEMREARFPADAIHDAGYSVAEMVAAFNVKELTAMGFTLVELRLAGVSAAELRKAAGITTTAKGLVAAGYTLEELRDAGVHTKELEKAGHSLQALMAGGFRVADLREDGYAWHELVIECRCTYAELLAGGYQAGKKGFGDGMDPNHGLFKQYAPTSRAAQRAGGGGDGGVGRARPPALHA